MTLTRTLLFLVSASIGLTSACSKSSAPAQAKVSKVENGRVAVEFANASEKEMTGGYLRFYCYDDAGKQSGLESVNVNFSLKAGATKSDSMPIRCATGAAAVETEWYWVSFGDGTKWENPSQPPDQRAKGGKS
ncbi:MAG: hypothetical protein U0263_41805 [Polyangiaceae bacterium]